MTRLLAPLRWLADTAWLVWTFILALCEAAAADWRLGSRDDDREDDATWRQG